MPVGEAPQVERVAVGGGHARPQQSGEPLGLVEVESAEGAWTVRAVGTLDQWSAYLERLAALPPLALAAATHATAALFDDEEARKRIEATLEQLYDAGVDALIIQDMGILQMDLPPIQLHASTHTVRSYRDTFRLLLNFAHHQTGKTPSQLDLADREGMTKLFASQATAAAAACEEGW